MNKKSQKLNQLVDQDINQNNNEIAKLMEKMANDPPICSRQSPYGQNHPQHSQTDQHRGIKASYILQQNELGSHLVG